jgi:BMFP domain-containing protein YqiC
MEEKPDSRLEKLIALLYGELPEDEERAIRREILRDAALRAEWEELSATRSLLGQWKVNEPAPRVIFVHRNTTPERARGLWARLRPAFAAPAWGLAAAAACLALLGIGQFRIEQPAGGGLAFRFGAARTSPAATRVERTAAETSTHAPAEYITRRDLDAYTRAMDQAVFTVMDGYARERDEAVTRLLQTALAGVDDRQTDDYRELSRKIDDLGSGLIADQAQTRARIDYLWHRDVPGRQERIGAAPAEKPEGDSHEEHH